jgi:hypothetical protein
MLLLLVGEDSAQKERAMTAVRGLCKGQRRNRAIVLMCAFPASFVPAAKNDGMTQSIGFRDRTSIDSCLLRPFLFVSNTLTAFLALHR